MDTSTFSTAYPQLIAVFWGFVTITLLVALLGFTVVIRILNRVIRLIKGAPGKVIH